MTESKRPGRLAQAMLETAKDMRSAGILDEVAYNKITMRHLGLKDMAELEPETGVTKTQPASNSAKVPHGE